MKIRDARHLQLGGTSAQDEQRWSINPKKPTTHGTF
jgi:hypothetical protein